MKKLFFLLLVIILITSCEKDITVYIEKGPSTIAGQILPAGIDAFVEIRISDETIHIEVDAEGYFKIEDLDPGHYNLLADAPQYGRKELKDIYVGDDEIYDIGIIELSTIPFPIDRFSISSSSRYSSSHSVTIYFTEEMNWESVIDAIQIEPNSDEVTYSNYSSSSYNYLSIYLDFQLGTTYTISIDTTALTIGGEHLEFPYTYSFNTEPFSLENFDVYNSNGYFSYLRFGFNSIVDTENFISHLTITPPIGVYTEGYYTSSGIYLFPANGWMSDTTITFTISHNFTDVNGNPLASDTTLSIHTDPFKIRSITPYNSQCYVSVNPYIRIVLNNVIDESTIKNALHFTPEFDYDIATNASSGYSYFYVYPDSSLEASTTYTIEIDTSLTDYYGVHLPEKFVSTFTTD
ncbi:MAG: Ig-like domain-containing protein [Candidatus Neomarinimicrobiota bacterium]